MSGYVNTPQYYVISMHIFCLVFLALLFIQYTVEAILSFSLSIYIFYSNWIYLLCNKLILFAFISTYCHSKCVPQWSCKYPSLNITLEPNVMYNSSHWIHCWQTATHCCVHNRVDAVKYMWPHDLRYIYSQIKDLNTDNGFTNGTRPFIYQNIIENGEFSK